MKRRSALSAVVAAAVLLPLTALADPYSDLVKARNAFQAAKSWHAVEHFNSGRTGTQIEAVDFSSPDRWRVRWMPNPHAGELVFGGGGYIVRIGEDIFRIQNGRSIKEPRSFGGVIRLEIGMAEEQPLDPPVKQTARDLGMQTVNGKSAHGYSYTSHGEQVTLYLGSDMLPIQKIVKNAITTTVINYSNFNAPITIAP